MNSQEKIVSEANKYVMPAVEDYLATRCLLLNNIFVGLTLAHEGVEKLMKALLIIEDVKFPKNCHELSKLAKLLLNKNSIKYEFLNNNFKFIDRLDKHYAWRYYDGDANKRSKSKSSSELHPTDTLWILLYECYMDFLPNEHKFRTYLISYLFAPMMQEYTSWPHWLLTDNRAIKYRVVNWKEEFTKWYTSK